MYPTMYPQFSNSRKRHFSGLSTTSLAGKEREEVEAKRIFPLEEQSILVRKLKRKAKQKQGISKWSRTTMNALHYIYVEKRKQLLISLKGKAMRVFVNRLLLNHSPLVCERVSNSTSSSRSSEGFCTSVVMHIPRIDYREESFFDDSPISLHLVF